MIATDAENRVEETKPETGPQFKTNALDTVSKALVLNCNGTTAGNDVVYKVMLMGQQSGSDYPYMLSQYQCNHLIMLSNLFI